MTLRPDRRAFIGGSVSLGSFALFGCKLTGSQDAGLKDDVSAPKLFVRKAVTSADAAKDLELYKKAITILKANKVWVAQATIHNNFCTHGNWFFLPWHRFYLMYFEEVCRNALRSAGESDDFAIPYWSWPDTGRKIPEVAWGEGNPLFDQTREMGPNDPYPDASCGAGSIANIMQIKNFLDYGGGRTDVQRGWGGSGQLEGTPHNTVHSRTGGDMGNFMSPLDPIFWMHHANVDRLWAQWQLEHPGIVPSNPNAADPRGKSQAGVILDTEFWMNFVLDGYEDVKGARFKQVLKDCLDHTKMVKPYTYDVLLKSTPAAAAAAAAPDYQPPMASAPTAATNSSGSGAAPAAILAPAPAKDGLNLTGATTVAAPVDRVFIQSDNNGLVIRVDQDRKIVSASINFSDRIRPYIAKLSSLPSYSGSLSLIIENIPVPADDLAHRISLDFYANHPELTTETDASDPHFLSSYSFFTHSHPGAPRTISIRISLNQPLLKMRAAGFELRDSMLLQVLVKDRLLQTLPSLTFFNTMTFRLTYTDS